MSIVYKIGLLIFILTLTNIVTVVTTYVVVSSQKYNALMINIAGRQRFLSQKIANSSSRIHLAEDFENIDAVKAVQKDLVLNVDLFEKSLNAMLNGGITLGVQGEQLVFHRSTGQVRKALQEVKKIWGVVKIPINVILDPQVDAHSETYINASNFVDENAEKLLTASNKMVTTFIEHSQRKISHLQYIQIIALIVVSLFALLAWLIVRKHIVSPIVELSTAVREIKDGNLKMKVDVRSKDEIGSLAEGIRSMAKSLAKDHMEMMQVNLILKDAIKQQEEKHRYITELNHELEIAKIDLEEKNRIVEEERSELEKQNEYVAETNKKMVMAKMEMIEKNKELEKTLDALGQTQNQLLQSEKMASVGQLAAGVAHEINNPIGFINSNVGTLGEYFEDLMKIVKKYEEGYRQLISDNETTKSFQGELKKIKDELDYEFIAEDAKKLISETRNGTERVSKIVQNLKEFSHLDKSEDMEFADINHCIESTLSIVWNELKYKAEIKKDYGDIPHVKCYPHQLGQVFMNLLVNASHAIEDKGKVGIRTWIDGEKVLIEISDTGKGMTAETMQKIFEPFFTTKPVGSGTGLGLSVSYGIIEKHGGRLSVESEEEKGSTFTIELPLNGVDEGEG